MGARASSARTSAAWSPSISPLRHPERVDRLVLACTSPGGAGGSSFDLLELEAMTPEERSARWLPLLDNRTDMSTDPPTLPPGLAPIAQALASGLGRPSDDPGAAMGAHRQLGARAAHHVWDDRGHHRAVARHRRSL
jgi:3-oxoadipate enol-lactonase